MSALGELIRLDFSHMVRIQDVVQQALIAVAQNSKWSECIPTLVDIFRKIMRKPDSAPAQKQIMQNFAVAGGIVQTYLMFILGKLPVHIDSLHLSDMSSRK